MDPNAPVAPTSQAPVAPAPVEPYNGPTGDVAPAPAPEPIQVPDVAPVPAPVQQAPVVEPQAPVNEPAVSPDILAQAQARNYDVSHFESPNDLGEFLLDNLADRQELERAAAIGRSVGSNYNDYLKWQESQNETPAAPAQPTPEPETTGLEWAAPEAVDPRYEAMLETDPNTGLYRAPADAPLLSPYADKANERLQWQKTTAERMLSDFPSLVEQVAAPKITALEQKIESLVNQQNTWAQQQHLSAIAEQHDDEWFVKENGQYVIDPRTNDIVPTPKYQAVAFYAEDLRKIAPNADDATIMQKAIEQANLAERAGIYSSAPVAPAAPAPDPVQVATETQQTFMQGVRNGHLPNRDGYQPDTVAPLGPPDRAPSMADLTIPEVKKLGLDGR